ncbi:cell division protein FtsQ/DivIB [Wenxinia marina]|uniref:Cell division protein FtsQ n=1 Tax=Wenxinia marina DSM 24838 TaxID=1123501 RepID=A0A0D0QCB4_9RHOB|nr:cell division protein FtsQ/DivIB [Wenxinia marina]KIQ68588.1 Cell division septal protein [Wenxinia marina DSM 24838]GGL67088.1 cell division protein FtsQ [Wenxinia marina]
MRSLSLPFPALSFRRRPDPVPGPRDPAPSRWGYRYQRLMLTPLFRATVRVGLPAFVVVFGAGLWFANEANRALVTDRIAAVRDQMESRPEFMVTGLDIDGADIALAAAISTTLGDLDVTFPVSSFDLDLEAIRAGVTDLTAVKDAVVRVRPGGTLSIEVNQRQPVAIWRHIDGLRLLDAEGVMTGMIVSRTDRPDLPLLAGDGARAATAEGMALIEAAAPLAERVRGLVRMGERRWDLMLDRDQRVLLPEENPVAALERLIALDDAQPFLERDISVIDLRNQQRITVRAGPMAADALRASDER